MKYFNRFGERVDRFQADRLHFNGGPAGFSVMAYTIYIRKMRYEMAEAKLEKELHQAFLSGVRHVEVVHGIGQGILKRMTREKVAELGMGRVLPEEDGWSNPGVTLVELDPPAGNQVGPGQWKF